MKVKHHLGYIVAFLITAFFTGVLFYMLWFTERLEEVPVKMMILICALLGLLIGATLLFIPSLWIVHCLIKRKKGRPKSWKELKPGSYKLFNPPRIARDKTVAFVWHKNYDDDRKTIKPVLILLKATTDSIVGGVPPNANHFVIQYKTNFNEIRKRDVKVKILMFSVKETKQTLLKKNTSVVMKIEKGKEKEGEK